jgi:hypothetical protein
MTRMLITAMLQSNNNNVCGRDVVKRSQLINQSRQSMNMNNMPQTVLA